MARSSRKNIEPYPRDRPLPPGMKRGRHGRLRKRSLTWRFRRFLLLFVLIAILAASGGAFVIWNGTELPQKDPPLLQTTFVCAADVTNDCNQDNSIAQLSSGVDRVTVPYEKIPPIFIQALVAAEDKDFFKHEGVDPQGIARALKRNIESDKPGQQGGSTITQQYVKNVYLSNEQTITRKLQEAVLAIKLDRELPKQEILERYLNTIYFGRNAYGIEAASRAYFDKHVEELGLPEAAYLAGLIRAPEGTDANRAEGDPLRARQQAAATDRRKQVLQAMVDERYITEQDRDAVAAMGWDYVTVRSIPKNLGKVKNPELGTQYFVDYVHRWLVDSGQFTDAQLFGGGLRIYTTLDFTTQAAAYEAITGELNRPDDPQSSIVAVDDKGRVRAMVGGFDYDASQVNLAVGQSGGGSGRQPGSSFKPLVLAAYLEEGKSLGQVYDAPARMKLQFPGYGTFDVGNYGDAGLGQLNVVEATARSSNTAYAQIMKDTGVETAVDMAEKLGITTLTDRDHVPATVLGTPSVSVLDMASAYSTFADNGEHVTPTVVTKVTNAQGQVLWEAPFERTRVLTEHTAAAVNWTLQQVVETGTGTAARYGQSIAGKTGTTDDYHDAWFVGYTCKLTAAVWVGYAQPGPDGKKRFMQGVHGINVAGGTIPTAIWRRFMSKATVGLDSCPYPRPADVGFIPGTSQYAPGSTEAPSGTAAPTTAPAGTTPPSVAPASSSTTAPPVESTTTTAPASTTTAPPASSTTTSQKPTTTTASVPASTTTVTVSPTTPTTPVAPAPP